MSVSDLKYKLGEKEGTMSGGTGEGCRLYMSGTLLEDARLIDELPIDDHTVIKFEK